MKLKYLGHRFEINLQLTSSKRKPNWNHSHSMFFAPKIYLFLMKCNMVYRVFRIEKIYIPEFIGSIVYSHFILLKCIPWLKKEKWTPICEEVFVLLISNLTDIFGSLFEIQIRPKICAYLKFVNPQKSDETQTFINNWTEFCFRRSSKAIFFSLFSKRRIFNFFFHNFCRLTFSFNNNTQLKAEYFS